MKNHFYVFCVPPNSISIGIFWSIKVFVWLDCFPENFVCTRFGVCFDFIRQCSDTIAKFLKDDVWIWIFGSENERLTL